MKRSVKYTLITVGTVLVSIFVVVPGAYEIYSLWPRYFPVFPIGSCIEDTHRRIHQVTGYEGRGKVRAGIPTRILVSGDAIAGTYSIGSEERVFTTDAAIRPIPCP